MPFCAGVGIVYGLMTYLTNSILPALVLHAIGDVFGGLGLLTNGQSEWQSPVKPEPLIWDSDTDYSFWISCFIFVIIFSAAVWAFKSLAAVARESVSNKVMNVFRLRK